MSLPLGYMRRISVITNMELPANVFHKVLDNLYIGDVLSLRLTCHQMNDSVLKYLRLPRVKSGLQTFITSFTEAEALTSSPPEYLTDDLDLSVELDEAKRCFELNWEMHAERSLSSITNIKLSYFFGANTPGSYRFFDSFPMLSFLWVEEVICIPNLKMYKNLPVGLRSVTEFTSVWSSDYVAMEIFLAPDFLPETIRIYEWDKNNESRVKFLQTITSHLKMRYLNTKNTRKLKLLDILDSELFDSTSCNRPNQIKEFTMSATYLGVSITKMSADFLHEMEAILNKQLVCDFLKLLVNLHGYHPYLNGSSLPNLKTLSIVYRPGVHESRRWINPEHSNHLHSSLQRVYIKFSLKLSYMKIDRTEEHAVMSSIVGQINPSTCPNLEELSVAISKPTWYSPVPSVWKLLDGFSCLKKLKIEVSLSPLELSLLFFALKSSRVSSVSLKTVEITDESFIIGEEAGGSHFLGIESLQTFELKTKSRCTECFFTDRALEILSRKLLKKICLDCCTPEVTPQGIRSLGYRQNLVASLQDFEFNPVNASRDMLEAITYVQNICIKNKIQNQD